jgi:hypothetical protein
MEQQAETHLGTTSTVGAPDDAEPVFQQVDLFATALIQGSCAEPLPRDE